MQVNNRRGNKVGCDTKWFVITQEGNKDPSLAGRRSSGDRERRKEGALA